MDLLPNLLSTSNVGISQSSGFLTRTLDSDSYLLYPAPSEDIDLLDLTVSKALKSNPEDPTLPRTGKTMFLNSSKESPTKLMRIGEGSWTLTRKVGNPTQEKLASRRQQFSLKNKKKKKDDATRHWPSHPDTHMPWKGEPEAQELRMDQNFSRGTRVRIPINHIENEITTARWANLNYLSGAQLDQDDSKSVSFVPVFPDKPSPYYKSVKDDNRKSDFDYDHQTIDKEDHNDRKGRPYRRRPKVSVQVHPTYGAPPPAVYAPPAPVYGAPAAAPPTVIVYKQPAPVYKHYKTGLDVTPALLGLLPIFLLGGLALGYLYPFNITTSSTSSSSGSSANDINLLNIIEIRGTNISNIFVPNNTATQTNTDSNVDNIVIADNNNNNNNTGRGWGLLDSADPDEFRDMSYLSFSLQTMLELLGTSWPNVLGDLLSSAVTATPSLVFSEASSLSRKMSCLEAANAPADCGDRVLCNHLADDHVVYDGNVLVRAGEVLAVTLGRWTRGGSAGEVAAIMRRAEEDDCDADEVECDVAECERID